MLLAYVRSRQAPVKPVLWIAHNAKRFDIPFLDQEFDCCSAQVPADWLFVDSLLLTKKLKKLDGISSTSGFLYSYNVSLHLVKTIPTALFGHYLGLFNTATSFYSHSLRRSVLLWCVWIQYHKSIDHICATIWMVLVGYIILQFLILIEWID